MQRALSARLFVLGLLLAGGMASACADVRPSIHPGPALALQFGAHDGQILINRAAEVRTQWLEFPRGKPITTREEFRATTQERYEALPDGGFRVYTTLIEAAATRDGTPVTEQFSQVGVTLISRVDSAGHFVSLENAPEAIAEIRKRITTPGLRPLVDSMLQPDAIRLPLQRAWEARFNSLCGKQFAPGEVTYDLDEQPVGEIGTVRTIVRKRVLGQTAADGHDALDIDLEFVGRDNDLARSPGASDALLGLPEGINALSVNVHGDGRQLVDLHTCQTFSQESELTGEGRLRDDMKDTDVRLPLKVRYEVRRQIMRLTPEAAQAEGIPTTLQPVPISTN